METFYNEATTKTPDIKFDPNTGVFVMKGKSVHENSLHFYQSIFNWVQEYFKKPAPKTTLTIQMDYFNTSSSKCLLDLFKMIDQLSKAASAQAEIKWEYDEMDDEMKEAGDEYKSIVKIPFNLVPFTK